MTRASRTRDFYTQKIIVVPRYSSKYYVSAIKFSLSNFWITIVISQSRWTQQFMPQQHNTSSSWTTQPRLTQIHKITTNKNNTSKQHHNSTPTTPLQQHHVNNTSRSHTATIQEENKKGKTIGKRWCRVADKLSLSPTKQGGSYVHVWESAVGVKNSSYYSYLNCLRCHHPLCHHVCLPSRCSMTTLLSTTIFPWLPSSTTRQSTYMCGKQ
jgi:hypothetical protein